MTTLPPSVPRFWICAAPMVAAEVTCQLFQPHLALRLTGAEAEMETRYREMEAMLERLRSVPAE